jgi:hypothetical protein
MEFPMKTPVLAAMLLALSTTIATAEINSLPGKAMSDLPGTKGGITASPTAKEFSGSLSDKAVSDRIGLNSGRTLSPLAQPDDNSLSGSEMKRLGARS